MKLLAIIVTLFVAFAAEQELTKSLLKNPEGCHSEPPQAGEESACPGVSCKMQIPRFARDDSQERFSTSWLLHSSLSLTGGRRLARANSYEHRLTVQGYHVAVGDVSGFGITLPPALQNYVIQAGACIYFRQEMMLNARGGLALKFTDQRTTNWTTLDQRGYPLDDDQFGRPWHIRYADLSAHVGKTISYVHSPARNATPNPASTTSAPATTPLLLVGSFPWILLT